MKNRGTWLVVGLLVACGESSGTQEPAQSAGDSGEPMPESADTFGESTPVPDGYTRYYSTVQTLGPGESTMLVEWVAPAFDEDMDVLDVSGGQTSGGHHALLYATAMIEEVGTVRPLDTEDQLVARSFGGPGGEGMDLRLLDLPEDYAFRLRKGEGLYIQSHYINVTEDTLHVRSYIDAKLAEPSSERTIITSFTNATVENELAPASNTETTVECVTQSDLKLVIYANHMHGYGKSVSTEAELPDGTRLMIKDDPEWSDEWQTNPNYAVTFDEPFDLPKGTTLRTHCTWENTTEKTIAFPDEMCVFFGKVLEQENDLACLDGKWSVRNSADGSAPSAPLERIGEGACSDDATFSALGLVRDACLALPRGDTAGCGLPLIQGDSECIVDCFTDGDVPPECGQCYGDLLVCTAESCIEACSSGDAEACEACSEANCCSTFEACSGVSCSAGF